MAEFQRYLLLKAMHRHSDGLVLFNVTSNVILLFKIAP